MGILVDKNTPPAAVKFGNEPDDGLEVNTVWIKRKLSFGDVVAVDEASYRMELAGSGDNAQAFRIPVSTTGQMVAALKQAVTGWEGPLFTTDEGRPIKYRKSIWEELDIAACEWWVRLVHAAVNERNKPATELPKANSPNEETAG